MRTHPGAHASRLLRGSASLDRPHAPAPLPDDWYVTKKTQYDDHGNPAFTWAPGNRCSAVTFDNDFGQLPILETVYVGAATGTVQGETCGASELTAQANFDPLIAVNAYGKACGLGRSDACVALAEILVSGRGVREDYPSALELFAKSCPGAVPISAYHGHELEADDRSRSVR